MTIPTFKLSEDSQTEGYAIDTNSILRIQSVLFDQHVLEFPAFLTDMSQTFTSTWNSENIFGRNDPIGIFQGTVRTVSLSFNLVAGTAEGAAANTDKLAILASFLYPSYKQNVGKGLDAAGQVVSVPMGSSHMYGSPLVRVKFANLIDNNLGEGGEGLLGWISGLSLTPVMDNGTFIVGSGKDAKHYPKSFDVSFDLNVLHDRTPGYNEFGGWLGNDYFFGGDRVFVEGQVVAQKLQEKAEVFKNVAGNVAGKIKGAAGGLLNTLQGFGSMGADPSPIDPDSDPDPFGVNEATGPSGPYGPES